MTTQSRLKERTVLCQYCGGKATLVTGKEIYPRRSDLHKLSFWLCAKCDAYVGTHKNSGGVPLGCLANAELRSAKSRAHTSFDPMWRGKKRTRNSAYRWLSKQLGIAEKKCHIGSFDVEMCNRVVDIMERLK